MRRRLRPPSQMLCKIPVELGTWPVDLGTLFEVVLNTGLDFGDRGEKERDAEGTAKKPDVPTAPREHQEKPKAKKREKVDGGGESGGVLPGLGGLGKQSEGGGMGGLTEIMDKVKLVQDVVPGIEGISCLIGKIIGGLTALMFGGPIGFAAWALWEVITGGIGEITAACKKVGRAMGPLKDLIGAETLEDPELSWLNDALTFLDSEADDNARKQVAEGKHKGAPLKSNANLIKAMYAGSTGDEDENAILQILRDTSDVKGLLIATSGEIKAGVDQLLSELQGTEDDQAIEILKAHDLDWLIDVADDVYARRCVADGTFRKMDTTQRAKLVEMMESGDCGDADEQAINRVLRFSLGKGDVGGVIGGAFGSVASGKDDLHSSIDGGENDEYHRIMDPWYDARLLGGKPSIRWADQIGGLPAEFQGKAKELLDAGEKMYKGETTWERALVYLTGQAPLKKPLDGLIADKSWKLLAGAYGGEFSPEERKMVRAGVNRGPLRALKRAMGLAYLKGKDSIEGGEKIRAYLAEEKAKEGEKKKS